MLKLDPTISNRPTLSLLGQVNPLGQTCPRQQGRMCPTTYSDTNRQFTQNCVNEIFVIVASTGSSDIKVDRMFKVKNK